MKSLLFMLLLVFLINADQRFFGLECINKYNFPNCGQCTSLKCLRCSQTIKFEKISELGCRLRICTPISQCINCKEQDDRSLSCVQCEFGYSVTANGECQKTACVDGCDICSSNNECYRCAQHYTLTNNICTRTS